MSDKKQIDEMAFAREFIASSIQGTEYEGKTFIAGGAVRDRLLGKEVKDIDILVNIRDGGIGLATFLGEIIGKVPVIYKNYGTAQLNLKGYIYKGHTFSNKAELEFVHCRKEAYRGKSRNPETEFGTIEQEAHRRDFTLNSLFEDVVTGEILDLTGKGLDDLENKILRSSGDPNIIFSEDPLRILRAIRFSTKYGLNIESETLAGMKACASQIDIICVERISEELRKILSAPNAGDAFRLFYETRLATEIFILAGIERVKELPINYSLQKKIHSFNDYMNKTQNLYVNMLFFFHLVSYEWQDDKTHAVYCHESLERVLFNLRFTNEEVKEVMKISYAERKVIKILEGVPSEQYSIDPFIMPSMITVIDQIKASEHFLEFIQVTKNTEVIQLVEQAYSLYRPCTLGGKDVMETLQLRSGQLVGRAIEAGKEFFFQSHCKADDEDILKYLLEQKELGMFFR